MHILITIILATNVRWHWVENHPIPTWYIAFAVSNYTIVSDSFVYGDSTMPIYYYMTPGEAGNAEIAFSNVPDMLKFYSDTFGALYPFFTEKFGFVRLPQPSPTSGWAMEFPTNVFLALPIYGSHSFEMLYAHETAHQWWGCSITPASIKDVWLNEGFATYCEALYSDHWTDGASYHDYMVSQIMNYYLSHENEPLGHPYPMYDPPDGAVWTPTTYEKGAAVLHMLRHVVGDSLFFELLRTYYQTFKYGNATTTDFQAIAETVSGIELDWFFTEWVYKAGHPKYECYWSCDSISPDSFKITLVVNQVQSHDWDVPTFKMPIDVEIYYDLCMESYVIWDSLDSQVFEFIIPDTTGLNIKFDPMDWVLKEATISGPTSIGSCHTARMSGLAEPLRGRCCHSESFAQNRLHLHRILRTESLSHALSKACAYHPSHPDRDIFHKPSVTHMQETVSSFDSTYPYDVLHYNIHLELAFPGDSITQALTEITARTVDTLSYAMFNFVGLTIDSVLVNGSPTSYERIGAGVDELLKVDLGGTLPAGDTFVVAVSYYGRPEEGIYYNTFNGGLTYTMSIPWEWTDLPVGARYWLPCVDELNDKATSEIWLTVPQGYKVVANGKLVAVDTLGIEEKRFFTGTQNDILEVYPNPFSQKAIISYSVNEKRTSNNELLTIHDISGRLIWSFTPTDNRLPITEITWDAHKLPSGIYFVKLYTGTRTLTKKLILIRR